ncbi:unnamed protein product, partial [Protopolystoma xenopodis]
MLAYREHQRLITQLPAAETCLSKTLDSRRKRTRLILRQTRHRQHHIKRRKHRISSHQRPMRSHVFSTQSQESPLPTSLSGKRTHHPRKLRVPYRIRRSHVGHNLYSHRYHHHQPLRSHHLNDLPRSHLISPFRSPKQTPQPLSEYLTRVFAPPPAEAVQVYRAIRMSAQSLSYEPASLPVDLLGRLLPPVWRPVNNLIVKASAPNSYDPSVPPGRLMKLLDTAQAAAVETCCLLPRTACLEPGTGLLHTSFDIGLALACFHPISFIDHPKMPSSWSGNCYDRRPPVLLLALQVDGTAVNWYDLDGSLIKSVAVPCLPVALFRALLQRVLTGHNLVSRSSTMERVIFTLVPTFASEPLVASQPTVLKQRLQSEVSFDTKLFSPRRSSLTFFTGCLKKTLGRARLSNGGSHAHVPKTSTSESTLLATLLPYFARKLSSVSTKSLNSLSNSWKSFGDSPNFRDSTTHELTEPVTAGLSLLQIDLLSGQHVVCAKLTAPGWAEIFKQASPEFVTRDWVVALLHRHRRLYVGRLGGTDRPDRLVVR